MCDFMSVFAEAAGPSDTSHRIYRAIFWLVMAAIFFGGMYYAYTTGAFG
ncbi:hypothetical protein [Patulibacter americanus]|nr:hypothetical protein [Patulibacter americanus]